MSMNKVSRLDSVAKTTIAKPILASLAFVMELTLVPLMLPKIQEDFGLAIGELSWFFNSYAASVAVGVLIGGWFGDVFSTRRAFKAGVLLFASGAMIVSFSSSYELITVGRIVQGFGGGLFSPLVPILLTKALPDRPGKVLIVWGSIVGYAAAFAPLLGGMIISFIGWKPIFWIFAVLALISLFLSTDEDDSYSKTRKAIILSCQLFLRARALWLMFGYIFCSYGCITYFLFILPLHLSKAEFTTQSSGLILAGLWFAFSVGSTVLRNYVDSDHVWNVVLAGPLLIVLGFLLAYSFENPTVLFTSAMAVGAGFACSNAPSTQLVLQFAPSDLRSISASLDITFARLGGVATVAAFAKWKPEQAILGVAVLLIIAMICVWICSRCKKQYKCRLS